MELQKNKQIKAKTKLNSKYQKQVENNKINTQKTKTLEQNRQFLIQRALQLSNEKQQAQQELTAAQANYLNQGNQLLELQTKLRDQEEEIGQLKAANITLNKIAKKSKSKN